ncbi:MAG: capsular polysaccharide export protein, LipB/KpsS family [Shimia sp.]
MRHVTTPVELKEAATGHRLLVVHATEDWLAPVREDAFDMLTNLVPHAEAQGAAVIAVTRGEALSEALLAQDHLHLLLGGGPLYRAGALHIAPAYLWGFWYLDETGVHADSSLRFRDYRPEAVDAGHAKWFFDGVTGHMLRENVSKIAQPERRWLDEAAVVVFCQEIEGGEAVHVGTEDMIRNAARAAQGGRVYVKAHPWQSEAMRARIAAACAADPNTELVEASVHDLIAAARVVVTQNAAAGFEALMQRKPVVTCARADYHHATWTAWNADGLREAIRAAPDALAGFDHERYLYWFLSERCVEPQADGFAARVWARLCAHAGVAA